MKAGSWVEALAAELGRLGVDEECAGVIADETVHACAAITHLVLKARDIRRELDEMRLPVKQSANVIEFPTRTT